MALYSRFREVDLIVPGQGCRRRCGFLTAVL